MTTFTDGPAKGKTLLLTRTPLYLRVVQNAAGDIDALNLVEDKPKRDEVCIAYHCDEFGGTVCVNLGRRTGGIYRCAILDDPEPARSERHAL